MPLPSQMVECPSTDRTAGVLTADPAVDAGEVEEMSAEKASKGRFGA